MTRDKTLAAVLLVPPLVAIVMTIVIVVAESSGVRPPFSELGPTNIAEAAGAGSLADVWRFLDAGQDATHLYDVRPYIISSSIRKTTPAEAAIWSRRIELIELLEHRGAIPDDQTRRHLACLADEVHATDILTHLRHAGDPACTGSEVAQISARGR